MARSSRISSGRTSRVPEGIGMIVICPGKLLPGHAAPGGTGAVTRSTARRLRGHNRLGGDALDARPEVAQPLVDALVAAVDLADVADLAAALRAQGGDEHRHARADVRRLQPLTAQA